MADPPRTDRYAGPPVRVGHGYDLHRLEPRGQGSAARPLVLGGVPLEQDRGVVAHSDGDALYHAVTDAILSAAGLPDIGQLFPDSDPAWAGADSGRFLTEASRLVREAGWDIGNVDATVVLEGIRIAPIKSRLRANIATCLGIDAASVGVKGKTHEKLDAVGEGRAVEVHAVALLVRR